jgi:NAD(P)-dependent dehydrogenase (short-subunit alcohol dehydrogenase family)
MVGQRSGSIISMVSSTIDIAAPNVVSYATAKAAVARVVPDVRDGLAPMQVRVSTIAPSWTDTQMNKRHAAGPTARSTSRSTSTWRRGKHFSPMGIPGEPDDIAFITLYLASPAAKFVPASSCAPAAARRCLGDQGVRQSRFRVYIAGTGA